MNKTLLIGIIAAMAVLLVVASCSKKEETPAPAAPAAPQVATTPAETAPSAAVPSTTDVKTPAPNVSLDVKPPAAAAMADEELGVKESDLDVGDNPDNGIVDSSVADVVPSAATR